MSRRALLSTISLIKNNRQASRIVRTAYRSSLILSVAVLVNALVAPAVMAAALPGEMAASKARAEADAKVLIGPNVTADSLGSAPQQPQAGAMPIPVKPFAVPAGNISSGQAQGIAEKSLNVTLDRPAGNARLVRSGNAYNLSTWDGSSISPADAEQGLRNELSFQGYTSVQINAAIEILKGIGSAAQHSASTLTLPVNAAGAIGLGANVTLSLPAGNPGAGNAAPLGQNAVVYSNTGTSTDTVVQAVDVRTVETYHIIRDKSAPVQFVYTFNNLPNGALLRQPDAQTVEAYFPRRTYGQGAHAYTAPETLLATIKAPWAHDASGASVPVYLTIGANNTVVLHVLHKNSNYLYPIVADPVAWWGWHGFMWWGDDWTITHYSQVFAGITIVAGLVGWPIAAAVAGIIGVVATWCEGRNGATFYFNLVPWWPFVSFAGCQGW